MLDGFGTYVSDKGRDLALYVDNARNEIGRGAANTNDYNALWGTLMMVAGGVEKDFVVFGIGLVMGVAGLWYSSNLRHREAGIGNLF